MRAGPHPACMACFSPRFSSVKKKALHVVILPMPFIADLFFAPGSALEWSKKRVKAFCLDSSHFHHERFFRLFASIKRIPLVVFKVWTQAQPEAQIIIIDEGIEEGVEKGLSHQPRR